MSIFDDLNAQGTTICIVTHDPRSAGFAHRAIELFDGRIISDNYRLRAQDDIKKLA